MNSLPIILDGRPETYSDLVNKAIAGAMEITRAWREGRGDEEAVNQIESDARQAVRRAFDLPNDCRIIFTSSIEEARNSAIKGLAWGAGTSRNGIITVEGDPAGFEESAIWLERFGFRSIRLPVGKAGGIPFPLLDKSVDDRTAVVALLSTTPEMYRWRIPEIRKLIASCERHGAELVIDVSVEVQVKRMEYDSSKMTLLCDGVTLGAPIGVAFVALRPGARFGPLVSGGLEQDGLRAGRLNPALVAGLAAAVMENVSSADPLRSAASGVSSATPPWVAASGGSSATPPWVAALSTLRQTALRELRRRIPSARLVHGEAPLPVGITFVVPGVEGEAVVMLCAQENVFVSTGSTCSKKAGKPSPVLLAAGFTTEEASGAIGLTFRAGQTVEDVKMAMEVIGKAVLKLMEIG